MLSPGPCRQLHNQQKPLAVLLLLLLAFMFTAEQDIQIITHEHQTEASTCTLTFEFEEEAERKIESCPTATSDTIHPTYILVSTANRAVANTVLSLASYTQPPSRAPPAAA